MSLETMSRNTVFDLSEQSVRDLNSALHQAESGAFEVVNPGGAHALACGLNAPLEVTIHGHAGYYCAGMNKEATVTVEGNAGTGCAENIMSGVVRVTSASGGTGTTKGGAWAKQGPPTSVLPSW